MVLRQPGFQNRKLGSNTASPIFIRIRKSIDSPFKCLSSNRRQIEYEPISQCSDGNNVHSSSNQDHAELIRSCCTDVSGYRPQSVRVYLLSPLESARRRRRWRRLRTPRRHTWWRFWPTWRWGPWWRTRWDLRPSQEEELAKAN